MLFKKITAPDFDEAYTILKNSFAECEMRSYDKQKSLLNNDKYTLWGVFDEKLSAVISVWNFTDFAFIEHFAVEKSGRGKGLGSEILQSIVNKYGVVALETEKDTDEFSLRRYNFYIRNGFTDTGICYDQPPLQGSGKVKLTLMACGLDYDPIIIKNTIFAEVYRINN